MKNVLKRLALVLVCILTLCACAVAGVACSDTDTLTITVTDENGNAVGKGEVSVQVCVLNFDETPGSCYEKTESTDENGKVTFSVKALLEAFPKEQFSTTYKIQINTAPAGYKSHATDPGYVYAKVDVEKEKSVTVKLVKE